MEENLVDDAFNLNKHGGDEFDDSCIIVGAINILGADGFGETVVGEFVSFDKSPIKAVDWGSTVNDGLGNDVFAKSVFKDR